MGVAFWRRGALVPSVAVVLVRGSRHRSGPWACIHATQRTGSGTARGGVTRHAAASHFPVNHHARAPANGRTFHTAVLAVAGTHTSTSATAAG